MADEKEVLDEGRDNGQAEATERSAEAQEHARDRRDGKDTREQIRAAMREHKGKSYDDEGDPVKPAKPREAQKDTRPRGEGGKFASTEQAGKDGAEAEAKTKADPASKSEIPPAKAVNEEANTVPPQAKTAVAPPNALSREIRAMWDQIPEAVQKEFVRREEDGIKGVEQLKAHYKAYDDAFNPVRDELSSLGKTEAEGMQMLINWRLALRGPNKVQAFKALAQSEGINLSQLTGPAPTQSETNGQERQPPAFDPNALRPMLDPVMQKVSTLEQVLQRQSQERVQADIADMSKGKPHFEKVRALMGHLINSGQVTGDNPREAFDKAYDMACHANGDVRALMQQEAEAKREADAKAKAEADAQKAAEADAERKRKDREALEKAKRATVGSRGGPPTGMFQGQPKQGEKVSDTIRRAVADARGAV